MTGRGGQLRDAVVGQIDDLIEAVSRAGKEAMRRPCPGREKLGDGTAGALAAHTVENYRRIGTFVARWEAESEGPRVEEAPARGAHAPGAHGESTRHAAEAADPVELVDELSAARAAIARVADFSDRQLDDVPATDSFKLCDGQRTFEQVLAGLLKHQSHQVRTLLAALR